MLQKKGGERIHRLRALCWPFKDVPAGAINKILLSLSCELTGKYHLAPFRGNNNSGWVLYRQYCPDDYLHWNPLWYSDIEAGCLCPLAFWQPDKSRCEGIRMPLYTYEHTMAPAGWTGNCPYPCPVWIIIIDYHNRHTFRYAAFQACGNCPFSIWKGYYKRLTG